MFGEDQIQASVRHAWSIPASCSTLESRPWLWSSMVPTMVWRLDSFDAEPFCCRFFWKLQKSPVGDLEELKGLFERNRGSDFQTWKPGFQTSLVSILKSIVWNVCVGCAPSSSHRVINQGLCIPVFPTEKVINLVVTGHSYWLIGRGPQSWLLARWLMTNTPWTVKLLLRPALLGRKSAEICFWFEEVVSKMEAPCFFLLWKQICVWLPLHRKPCQIYKNSFTENIPWIFKLKSCSPTW